MKTPGRRSWSSATSAAATPSAPRGVPIGTVNGLRFVEKTADILRYLAVTWRVPQPHF